MILRPHIEERGTERLPVSLDRFDVYGELILVSRQSWYDGARELLRRGYTSGATIS